MFIKTGLFFFLCVLGLLNRKVHAKTFVFPLDSTHHQEIDLDLDAYYSALSYIKVLREDAKPMVLKREASIYSYLLMRMHQPSSFLIEASINPLPFTGVLIREHASSVYENAEIGPNLNAISAVTTGFPEPWAMSFFWGNVISFLASETSSVVTGKGYGGTLLSVGNYHIVDHYMVHDYWAEGEIKLKGSDVQPSRHMSWSFRIGAKIHSHPDIFPILYFALKRDRVDLKDYRSKRILDLFIKNSEIELRIDTRVPQTWKAWQSLTRILLLAGKTWPSNQGNYAFSLGLGVQYQFKQGYRGDLAQKLSEQHWELLVRPNFHF